MNLDLQLPIDIGPDGKVRQDARPTGMGAGYGIRSMPTTYYITPPVQSQ